MRRKKRSFESLESRVVLNAAPVLVRDVGDSSVMVATAETTRHQALTSYEPDESGYDDAKTKLVADFTGDGIDDVFVEWSNGEWGMRINDGTQLFLMPWGDAPSLDSEIIDTADFNNDGLEDVLSYDRVTGDVWVSLNSISGGFTNERWSKFTPKTEWTSILVNDFDGDGWVDVLGGESGGGWWLAKNIETTFNNFYWGRLGKFDWQDLVSDDFTGDGVADVAGRASDNTWWLWPGQQDSQKTTAEYFGHWKMNDDWFDVDAADFDGDGKADIIGRSDDGLLWVGKAGESRFETDLWGKGWIHSAEWTNMSIVDMNGDDLPDQVGKAKDGTWWYAANNGEQFRNHYWQKSNANTSFVSTNFFRDVPADLTTPLTGNEPNVSAADTSPVKVSVNDDGFIVLTGSGVETRGINLVSTSGSLIPALDTTGERPSSPDFTDPVAAPFQFFLSNHPQQVALGNLMDTYLLDGSVTLNVGWDSTGDADLVARFGQGESEVDANVDDALELKFVQANQVVTNRATYQRIIHGRRTTAGSTSVTPVVAPAPSTPVVTTPAVSRPASNDVKMTVNEDGLLVVTGSSVELFGLDLHSASGSLIPVPSNDAAPFGFMLTNTPNQVTYGSLNTSYILDGSLTLSVGWNSSGNADLRAQWGGPEDDGPVDVDDELDADVDAAVSVNAPPIQATSSDVKMTVNEDGLLVMTGSNVHMAGIDLVSASGSIVPATTTDASPFMYFLANTNNQVTYGNLGSNYILDGSFTLSAGWDVSGPSDLIAQWGNGATPVFFDVDDILDGDLA